MNLPDALSPTEIERTEGLSLKLDQQQIIDRIKARQASIAANCNSAKVANYPGTTSQTDIKTVDSTLILGSWKDALPFSPEVPPQKFPIDALPPLIRNAVLEVQSVTQAPLPMVVSSALCAMSTAIQGLVDVFRTPQLGGPTSLYFVILGDSGERKSTVDKFFSKPLQDYHEKSLELSKPQLANFKATFDSWQARYEGLKSAIKNQYKAGLIEDLDDTAPKNAKKKSIKELRNQLEELNNVKPIHPLLPNLLITDITTEKLQLHLSQIWPSCALTSAEGGLILGGRSMSKDNELSTLSTYNALWSGEPLRISRKIAETFEVLGARFSLSIFVQASVFAAFLEEHSTARHVGFLARCLFAFPESTQGTRLFRTHPEKMKALDEFNEHITKFLNFDLNIVNGSLKTSPISLSEGALKKWIQYHDETEIKLGKNGLLESLRDFGSKSAENAARLAAVIQACKSTQLISINEDSMSSGCEIAHWFLHESVRYFGLQAPDRKKHESEAQKLLVWLVEEAKKLSQTFVGRSDVMPNLPNFARGKETFDSLLTVLEQHNYIRTIPKEKPANIYLHPNLF